MALQDLLKISEDKIKIGLSEERVSAIIPVARQYIAYWREYPDMMVDFFQTGRDGTIPESGLKFYFYQRVFLRAAMRYKYVYMVFPRAYSKSFLSILVLMCRCVLYPRAKLFVTSGGKEQAAGIVKEKVNEICTLVPAFDRELDRRAGKTREGKDYVCYMFKNGSFFDNIAASEKSRGKRRHGGLVEECVGVDGTILSEVIIPTMNVSRQCMDGSTHNEEILNKSQIFVTTAGYKNTFAGLILKVIGELKLGEPRNRVCAMRANSESRNVTLCQAPFRRRFRDYRKHAFCQVEVSRVEMKNFEAPRI